jgi:uncharacterized protein
MYLSVPLSPSASGQVLKLPNGRAVSVEVMDTPELRAAGMQFRTSMDRPMLFVFPDEAKRSYHMRNVRMPLDLILMNSGGQVLTFQHLSAESGRSRYCPNHSAAIEAPAGWARANNLKIGDLIQWG